MQAPHPLDRETCDEPEAAQKRYVGRLCYLQKVVNDEVDEVGAGNGFGGSSPRSITECFSKTMSALQLWLSRAEAVLSPLNRELRDARAILGFCHFARQEYPQAMALYEKIAETERLCYPFYSHHRIGMLMHLVKLLALQGQGTTARFEALVEEVAALKRVNYGAGMEDSVGDASVKSDMFISRMQEGLARSGGGGEGGGGGAGGGGGVGE